MNKKLAELIAKRNALKTEARSLLEATDIPADELEEKSNTIVAALAEIERNIEALKRLLEVAEEVEETVEELPELPEAVVPSAEEEDEVRSISGAKPYIKRSAKRRSKREAEIRSAFTAYIASNDETARQTLNAESRAFNTVGGAGLIPSFVAEEIMQEVKDDVFIRSIARVKTIPGNQAIPVFSGVGEMAIVPEGGDYPTLDLSETGPKLNPLKIGGIIPLSYELIHLAQSGEYDLLADVAEAISDAQANLEEKLFLIGNGTTEPQGVFTGAPVKVTAGDALTAQDVAELWYSLGDKYRRNAAWVMHPKTAAYLRALESTGGQLVWATSLERGVETLMGAPVFTSPYAPEMGTGKTPIVLGDFSRYVIGDRLEKWVVPLSERYADKGMKALQITSFGDAKIAVSKAFAALKQA